VRRTTIAIEATVYNDGGEEIREAITGRAGGGGANSATGFRGVYKEKGRREVRERE